MSDELTHLIKMINQISANQPKHLSQDEASHRVAEHVNKFWALTMRTKLSQHAYDSQSQLDPISQSAMQYIRVN